MTVRNLVLLRHAKAEIPDHGPDIGRSLTERGRRDAGAAGAWLATSEYQPDLVICSPATRTRQTWHGVAIALAAAEPSGGAPEVHYEQGLYTGGRTELVDLVRAVPETVHTVLIIGHNPTVSEVSLLLRPDDAVLGTTELHTCGLAVHRLTGTWATCEPGTAELVRQHTARA